MRKIEDYWEFNITKFVIDYPEYKKELEDCKDAIAEIAETSRKDYTSPPGTAQRGDRVPAAVEEAERIRRRILNLENLVNLYESAAESLTLEEKFIIEYLYHKPGLHTSNVRFVAKRLHMDISTVYRRKNAILKKISKSLGVKTAGKH